ncbi:conserved hypothetical protein [Roseibium sp. TrichSKD4]|nr:conserved hypothetical protein [Roseibium sp. TrichSKD4]
MMISIQANWRWLTSFAGGGGVIFRPLGEERTNLPPVTLPLTEQAR